MAKKQTKTGKVESPKPLTKIMIAGREYPCRVTMGALLRFKRATGKELSEMDFDDMEELMVFLHSCVASACKADGKDFDLDVLDMADQMEPDALNAFYSSMATTAEEKEREAEREEAEKKAVPETGAEG